MTDTAPFNAAPQHGPRPLPLFLDILRSETAAFPERRTAALAGLHAYQNAVRRPRPQSMPVVAQIGRARLLDYGSAGNAMPVVFIPSLINPPFILDLDNDNSLLRWLATQNVRPLLVDWGTPGADDRDMDISGHVEHLLLPLLDAIGEPAALVGYCLGGTMAVAAAALAPVKALALIATPWHFTGFPVNSREGIARLWDNVAPSCEAMGLLPMEILQSLFWQLDPARTITKFENFSRMAPGSAQAQAFVALEDWANGGAPLTLAAGKQAFTDFFMQDLPGQAQWQIRGTIIRPDTLQCPTLDIISLNDAIVPAATATNLPNRTALNTGHVGMIIGSRARSQTWEVLAQWLTNIT